MILPSEGALTTTIGRYKIIEKVGQGGMGVVYRAHDTLLEREVALKIIGATIEGNTELRERFFREARSPTVTSSPFTIWASTRDSPTSRWSSSRARISSIG
jgi:serine/threonine protein kinase